MTTPADLVAFQRAQAERGRDAVLAEIRRRWPNISDMVLPTALERILVALVVPPARFAGHGEPHRDGPIVRRRNRTGNDFRSRHQCDPAPLAGRPLKLPVAMLPQIPGVIGAQNWEMDQ